MNVIVNGAVTDIWPVDPLKGISYERLCLEAGERREANPTVVYFLPDGRRGSVAAGQRAPLQEGAVYDVVVTGAA